MGRVKQMVKNQVLELNLPGVGILSGPCGSIFHMVRASQLLYNNKNNNKTTYVSYLFFSINPLAFGLPATVPWPAISIFDFCCWSLNWYETCPKWGPKCSKMMSKIVQNDHFGPQMLQNEVQNGPKWPLWTPLGPWPEFWYHFCTILSPTGVQNEAQNASKMTPKVSLIFMMIFASF